MRLIILSSEACLAVPHFSTLSHKRHDFRKKKVLNTKYVFWWFSVQILCETYLILRRTDRDNIKHIGVNVKYALFLLDFNQI